MMPTVMLICVACSLRLVLGAETRRLRYIRKTAAVESSGLHTYFCEIFQVYVRSCRWMVVAQSCAAPKFRRKFRESLRRAYAVLHPDQ